MKISDLIRFRNTLQEQLDALTITKNINDASLAMQLTITQSNGIDQTCIKKMISYKERFDDLSKKSEIIIDELRKYIIILEEQADLAAIAQFGTNYKIEWNRVFIEGYDRDFYVTDNIHHIIKSRILQYIDWHYPVLQFGCRYNGQEPKKSKTNFRTLGNQLNDPDIFLDLTEILTGGEPLYVCDFNKQSMQRNVLKFTPEYQNKICQYVINDNDFSALPAGQFSFILCWNMFNYVTLEILKKYIVSLSKLLKPGGVILFSYNNCDITDAMLVTEIGVASYMPKRHVIQLCTQLGFEVLATYDLPNEIDPIPYTYISWIEIKKPGELTTVKAHSSLGKIIIK